MPPRTNACATCRKKRIKCDATLPHCLMCQRFGRQCPGPESGPVIINMTTQTMSKAPRTKHGKDGSVLVLRNQPPMARSLQISPRKSLNEVFYSTFLAYFTTTGEDEDIRNKNTWLHKLPGFSTDGTNTALEVAVQAVASAFSGVKGPNMALLQDACILYGKALHLHSHLLRLKKEITVHIVSTTVLLSFFEAMHATTASAYRNHINGAAKMIEVAGPEQCMQGVLCQIYFHIRTQLTFVYLTSKKHETNKVCAEKVLRDSLRYEELPVGQRLLTLISRLSEVYVRLKEGFDQDEMQTNAAVVSEVQNAIDVLEIEYKAKADQKGGPLTWKTSAGAIQYRNPYTAVCIAYFATVRMLLAILAPRLSVPCSDSMDFCDIILDATKFLSTVKIGCAFMRMSTPLYLVAVHASRTDQRMKALGVFEDWKASGLGGISALALEKIYEHGAGSARAMLTVPETRALPLHAIREVSVSHA
jgi:hypothetical protein